MAHRAAMFAFGAARGMNTYLYAPKDDPYHRERWRLPYPEPEWRELCRLIDTAQGHGIDFVYGFHPGKDLCFATAEPVQTLLDKATRLHDRGVRTFAVLFDDIPSHLTDAGDVKRFDGSLAKAESLWLEAVLEAQPADWDAEWWFCPSYYTPDPLLARMFGEFEPGFPETVGRYLPPPVACFWTGPKVVPESVTLEHMAEMGERLGRRLLFWDNYPVNDLSMADEMHIGPLTGRDPRLPERVHAHLANPLLQEELSFVPMATCFDYARDPGAYDPEASWDGGGDGAVRRGRSGSLAGAQAVLRTRYGQRRGGDFLGIGTRPAARRPRLSVGPPERSVAPWEFEPWRKRLEKALG